MLELGGSTPSDRALDHVMKALIGMRQVQGPDDPARGPVYVILATDGAPNDICVNGTGGDSYDPLTVHLRWRGVGRLVHVGQQLTRTGRPAGARAAPGLDTVRPHG